MLANRERDEKRFTAQRDAITDLLVCFGDIRQAVLDNVAELVQVILANFMSDAQEKFAPQIEQLRNASADISKLPRFLFDERIESKEFRGHVAKALTEGFPEIYKRMVALDLLVDDVDLRASLDELRKSWSQFAKAWNDAKFLATNWETKKPPDVTFPQGNWSGAKRPVLLM